MNPTISRGLVVVASLFAALSLALVPALFSIGEPIRALASLAAGGALVLYVVASRQPAAGEEVEGAVLHPYDPGNGLIGYTRFPIEAPLEVGEIAVQSSSNAAYRAAWLFFTPSDSTAYDARVSMILTENDAAQLGIALLAFSADALDREALAAYVDGASS